MLLDPSHPCLSHQRVGGHIFRSSSLLRLKGLWKHSRPAYESPVRPLVPTMPRMINDCDRFHSRCPMHGIHPRPYHMHRQSVRTTCGAASSRGAETLQEARTFPTRPLPVRLRTSVRACLFPSEKKLFHPRLWGWLVQLIASAFERPRGWERAKAKTTCDVLWARPWSAPRTWWSTWRKGRGPICGGRC